MKTPCQTNIYVVTAPSGTGKTTLNRRLVQEVAGIEFSISHTTRTQRKGEINGDHYWFVSKEEFQTLIEQKQMLEWADVFGNYYGTSKSELTRIRRKNHSALLEIDVQGWQQAKLLIPDAVAIFILPPSILTLWQRLEGRGTDSLETRLRRIKSARMELEAASQYHHFIVNDSLPQAFQELYDLVTLGKTPKLDYHHGLALTETLKQEYDNAQWLRELET